RVTVSSNGNHSSRNEESGECHGQLWPKPTPCGVSAPSSHGWKGKSWPPPANASDQNLTTRKV
ncbi:hypothetical protein S245_068044, partial [Arachis hypogaea]